MKIYFLYTVIWFQVYLSITNNLQVIMWFQVTHHHPKDLSLPNLNNSIPLQSFIRTQSYGFKYSNQTLIICLTYRWDPRKYYQFESE